MPEKVDKLLKKYSENELHKIYDFSEIITYDMLSDESNELREVFADGIAEYFNNDTSINVDSTGRVVDNKSLEILSKSVIMNEKGQLIPLYHGTDRAYNKLKADVCIGKCFW